MELEITIDNIQDIKKKRLETGYVALFYSHNCGHCVSFMPTWKLLKKKLSKQYQFVELEYEGMQKLKKEHNITFGNVKYFPYICIYSPDRKEHIEYKEGRRNEDSLTNFIEKNLNQLLPTKLDNNNIINKLSESTVDDKKGYILLVHWKTCPYCVKFMPLWNDLKKKYNGKVQFFELEREDLDEIKMNENRKLAFLNGVRSFPSIIIYNNDSQLHINYEEERNMTNLSNFIETNLL